MKKFFITTPIYYVNDVPHIGHAYTTIASDILARYYRVKGADVFYLTGTDEHGAKIAQAAQKSGKTPKEFCDGITASFQEAWKALNISNDGFIRTTDAQHIEVVNLFLQKLFDSGAIYKKKYEGLYCVHCEKFLTEADLNEELCCPDHKQKPSTHSEENYFFKLSQYQQELLNILTDKNHPSYIEVLPVERRNEIIGKLKLGLEDISISRAACAWGIELPFDKNQTAYVWIDALLNYVSGIGYGTNPSENFKKYWPCDVHLMAKDILWFHSVIWPAMLMAVKLPLPKKVFAHGFFTINNEKMSKTLGNIIRPDELVSRFGVDAARYLTVSLFPFGLDGDISWQALTDKYNNDMANNLGNLVSRTVSMAEKYFESKIPSPSKPGCTEKSKEVLAELINYKKYIEGFEFSRATDSLQKAIDIANRYVQQTAPWKMVKENDPTLPDVIYSLLQNVGLIALHLTPIMPQTAQKIWESLGNSNPVTEAASKYISTENTTIDFPVSGKAINKLPVLFPRIVTK